MLFLPKNDDYAFNLDHNVIILSKNCLVYKLHINNMILTANNPDLADSLYPKAIS